ncbi:little elongation complex subunit 1-like isoform X2 [Tachysurus ichikawai]
MSPTRNVKRPQLDNRSPDPASPTPLSISKQINSMDVAGGQRDCHTGKSLISSAIKKLQKSCFDAFPTVSDCLLCGRVSEVTDVFSHDSSLSRAIHKVTKLKAEGEISDYLNKYLHWDEFLTIGLCPSQTGRLGQLGLKEKELVQNIANGIKDF